MKSDSHHSLIIEWLLEYTAKHNQFALLSELQNMVPSSVKEKYEEMLVLNSVQVMVMLDDETNTFAMALGPTFFPTVGKPANDAPKERKAAYAELLALILMQSIIFELERNAPTETIFDIAKVGFWTGELATEMSVPLKKKMLSDLADHLGMSGLKKKDGKMKKGKSTKTLAQLIKAYPKPKTREAFEQFFVPLLEKIPTPVLDKVAMDISEGLYVPGEGLQIKEANVRGEAPPGPLRPGMRPPLLQGKGYAEALAVAVASTVPSLPSKVAAKAGPGMPDPAALKALEQIEKKTANLDALSKAAANEVVGAVPPLSPAKGASTSAGAASKTATGSASTGKRKRAEEVKSSGSASKKRVPWADFEIESLRKGLEKHGKSWSSILSDPDCAFKEVRTQVHLKDKYRTLLGQSKIQAY